MSRIEQYEIDRLKDARRLSEIVGRDVVWDRKKTNERRQDYWACCVFHGEKSPSFHVDDRKGRYYCLGGETKVITFDGVMEIRDLAGSAQMVMAADGRWVEGKFASYGEQPLYEIRLSRNGLTKAIRATAEHRWFVYDRPEKTTSQLRPGARLIAALPIPPSGWAMSDDGLRHGIVFGDGTLQRGRGRGYLHGEKIDDLEYLFYGYKTYKYSDHHVIDGLPAEFKSLPKLDRGDDYLRGFLAGLIATDGHVAKDGTIQINQADPAILDAVRQMFLRVGVPTFPVTVQSRIGIGSDKFSNIHRIHISTMALPIEALIRSKQKARAKASAKKFERWRWNVVSVSAAPVAFEEVFCAEVSDGHAFTLEDNILTGNCFGCGASGDHIRWLMDFKKLSFPEAIRELGGQFVEQTDEQKEQRAADQVRVQAERERRQRDEDLDRQRRSNTAAGIWADCKPIAGTLGERYLADRGLSPPDQGWPDCLGFHAGLEWELGGIWEDDKKVRRGPVFPCLVGRVDDVSGNVVAVWRIFLDPETAKKAAVENPKVGLGPARGGAVRIGGVGPTIGAAEGIETALGAWALIGFKYPVWATLSTSGMQELELPLQVKKVRIFADGDKPLKKVNGEWVPADCGAGLRAARRLRDRCGEFDVEGVIQPVPGEGSDYLDIWNTMRGFEAANGSTQ